MLTLETLPSDILYIILSYCDNKCLYSLSFCCKKFYNLLKNDDYVWLKKSCLSLATNQKSKQIKCRSSCLLSSRQKCKISSNWKKPLYKEICLVRHKSRYLPWIWLEKEFLWFTKGNSILMYKRNNRSDKNNISQYYLNKLQIPFEDICRFVIKNNLVISGGRKGSITVWNKFNGKLLIHQNMAHLSDCNSVDCSLNNILVSGSKDTNVKVWSIYQNSSDHQTIAMKCHLTIPVEDRVWSVAINDYRHHFIVGSAGCGPLKPLLLYDIESGQLLSEFGNHYQRGAGVLHSLWESETQVLSCGYDSCVRLWDTRSTQNCAMKCEDPHDSAVYSVSSDHFVTILSGTARYGLTRLWDKRFPNKCIQMYYVGKNNTPVYSLCFDPSFAYIALESSINLLSFS